MTSNTMDPICIGITCAYVSLMPINNNIQSAHAIISLCIAVIAYAYASLIHLCIHKYTCITMSKNSAGTLLL